MCERGQFSVWHAALGTHNSCKKKVDLLKQKDRHFLFDGLRWSQSRGGDAAAQMWWRLWALGLVRI